MTLVQTLETKDANVAHLKTTRDDLKTRTRAAAAIASDHADAVDREGRFPSEAFDALRAKKLMGVMIPRELGGEGASLAEVADICYALGRACGSTGMIYAMHQTKLACMIRHGGNAGMNA